ncbi:hypothetical protein DAI22_12g163225 [Oryza sativa Japonica Group]|nr:hypothetical protein DAI22_12g163225 [Oryza sativa Japonica Group]
MVASDIEGNLGWGWVRLNASYAHCERPQAVTSTRLLLLTTGLFLIATVDEKMVIEIFTPNI